MANVKIYCGWFFVCTIPQVRQAAVLPSGIISFCTFYSHLNVKMMMWMMVHSQCDTPLLCSTFFILENGLMFTGREFSVSICTSTIAGACVIRWYQMVGLYILLLILLLDNYSLYLWWCSFSVRVLAMAI